MPKVEQLSGSERGTVFGMGLAVIERRNGCIKIHEGNAVARNVPTEEQELTPSPVEGEGLPRDSKGEGYMQASVQVKAGHADDKKQLLKRVDGAIKKLEQLIARASHLRD